MDNSSFQPTAQPVTKSVSHKASIAGLVFTVLSLILAGLGHFLVTMKPEQSSSSDAVASQVGNAVSTGTTAVIGTVLGIPFSIAALVAAAFGILLVLIRLRKVRVMGFVFSVFAILLGAWAISIALGTFELVKAHPA